MEFTFKGEASPVSNEWKRGFNDCLDYHKGKLIHKRILKFTSDPQYTNGWAEGNITAYCELHEFLESKLKDSSQ